MADHQTIRDWLGYIASINVGGLGKRELELRLALLVPALAEEFDARAFTLESARHVAGRCTHFPVFGEIVPLLQAWQRETKLTFGMLLSDHRAYEPPPSSQDLPERTTEELNAVQQLANETVAMLRHNEVERLAQYRTVEMPVNRRQMTRAELNEAYRRAGVKGPELPKPTLRAVAASMPQEVKRGEPVEHTR